MKLANRAKAPTPKFFKVLRTIGLALAAVGATIMAAPIALPMAAPIALPMAITTIGGYLVVAGGVASAVSQLTIDDDKGSPKTDEHDLQ